MQAKKPRLPRIDRYDEIKVHEDDNQHLWAVSYADFLMVLLSFFVIFFSTDEKKQETLIQRISLHFNSNEKSHSDAGNGEPLAERLPASFKDIAALYNFQISTQNKSIYIHFPENFFAPGKHVIETNNASIVKKVLTPLIPYAGDLNIFFEGHADKDPLKLSRNSIVKDNFVLSSLRASSALDIARSNGFPEDHLFIKATSSNIRNSRSLTIRITPKGEQL